MFACFVGCQAPTPCWVIDHYPLNPEVQPVFSPPNAPFIQPILPQVINENSVGATVKSVKAFCIHCFPFIHIASHFVREVNQAGQAQFVLAKSMLTVPDCLLVLHMFKNRFWENVVHEFSGNRDDPDKWVVEFLLAFLKGECNVKIIES